MELPVHAVARQQLMVAANLANLPRFDDHDAIGVHHRREAMRDDERCAAVHEPPQRIVDEVLRLGIQSRSGLVENENWRVLQKRARNRYPLALAAR